MLELGLEAKLPEINLSYPGRMACLWVCACGRVFTDKHIQILQHKGFIRICLWWAAQFACWCNTSQIDATKIADFSPTELNLTCCKLRSILYDEVSFTDARGGNLQKWSKNQMTYNRDHLYLKIVQFKRDTSGLYNLLESWKCLSKMWWVERYLCTLFYWHITDYCPFYGLSSHNFWSGG